MLNQIRSDGSDTEMTAKIRSLLTIDLCSLKKCLERRDHVLILSFFWINNIPKLSLLCEAHF